MARLEGHIFNVIDDLCYGCGACIGLCPVSVLELEDQIAIVDEKNCIHCKLCIPSCPVFALELKVVNNE